jgi:predicted P-loop ATPase
LSQPIATLADDRDQLFAEAAHQFRDGAEWWPDKNFERQYIEPEQEARYEPDVWEDPIRKYLASVSETTVGEVAKEALFIETRSLGKAEQVRISTAMSAGGWKRAKRKGDRRPWVRA